jgi:hypothetical protein
MRYKCKCIGRSENFETCQRSLFETEDNYIFLIGIDSRENIPLKAYLFTAQYIPKVTWHLSNDHSHSAKTILWFFCLRKMVTISQWATFNYRFFGNIKLKHYRPEMFIL